MTDETNPPAGEPEPGSTDWLLAQLSGGRIDSRRERREAEAALEAAGVPIPDPTQPVPVVNPPAPQATPPVDSAPEAPTEDRGADERPRARFSWETGLLQAVPGQQTPGADGFETPAAPAPQPAGGTPTAPAPAPPAADDQQGIPFLWHLAPTHDPDPAVNPHAELPEPASAEAESPFLSAAPLVVPKPQPAAPLAAAEPVLPEPPAAPVEPAVPAVPPAGAVPPAPAGVVPPPPAGVIPPPPAHPPLPPGTTAYEFDPFAQDLFAPRAAPMTPVPSVDEFTIPDEGAPAGASVPTGTDANETPAGGEVSSDWADISDLLGAHPQTVDTAIISPMPPVNEILPSFDAMLPRQNAQDPAPGQPVAANAVPPRVPTRPGNAPVEHRRGESPLNRWLLIAAAILLAILIGVALFAVGRAVAAGRNQAPVAATTTHTPTPTPTTPTPTPTPTPTSTPVDALAGTGPLAPGETYQWDQLRGGECINPFGGPWAQQFTVVDCSTQHAAQLVYAAPFSSDPSAAFPGEQAISSQVNSLCSKPGVIDLNAAASYSDVQVSASYPVTADQWNAGDRDYYCFVTRASGQPFSSSIAGPGPTQ